jgi:hypothetical protein
MADKKNLVNYTSRDFKSIKRDLEQHARLYYPDSFKDFSENTFGSYVTDAVSYVGDMLSFYLDFQANETFMETSLEYNNVRKHATRYGYKSYGRPSAYGLATFYVMVPSQTSGQSPDPRYIPLLKAGTEMSATNGTTFVLTQDVDFSHPDNEIVAARFDSVTTSTTHFAIRAHGQIKSNVLFRKKVDIGEFKRFRKARVGPGYISQIISVIDSEGHEYYEVDCLSQDVVYMKITNTNDDSSSVPQIIKPKIVPRRFVVIQDSTGTYLQFGQGSDEEHSVSDITDPSQSILKMSGKNYITDEAFDPREILSTNTLGVAPSNTTLEIIFDANDKDQVNIAKGGISEISRNIMEFPRGSTQGVLNSQVRASLEVSNDAPIVGNTKLPTAEEIRHRSYASHAAQMRAVTKNDYEAMIYMMPPGLGSVKRAYISNDPSSSNRRLSLYVISEDENGYLCKSNSSLKENLKVWLNKNKMINDNIDIYDAKIINLGFDYEVIVHPTRDKIEVLNEVSKRLRKNLSETMYIGESFSLTNIFNIINKTPGIIDTTKVVPKLVTGTGYSNSPISISQIKSNDGMRLVCPRNAIFEIRVFNSDVRGAAI